MTIIAPQDSEARPATTSQGAGLAMRGMARAALATVDDLYRLKNRRQPRILVYTDSRGKNLANLFGKAGYGTHVSLLRAKYNLTYTLCPEKYTTIVDFLNFLGHIQPTDFDAIVMHCGIVDFSPRPLSNIARFKRSKAKIPRFQELVDKNDDYYQQPFNCQYYGEPTINIYSEDFLINDVLPELMALPNLIWINSNHFVPGWEGNYTRGRPANIDEVVCQFDAVMHHYLPVVVDLKTWTPEQVQELTIDNLHFTRAGFKRVFDLLDVAVQSVI